MLVLTNTDRLRCNLDKLCKRILKTSCDRSRTSLSNIKIRKFLCRQFACGIYRCTGLIGDHILYLLRNFLQKFHDNLFRLSGGCSISKRNQRNSIFADQHFERVFCCLDLLLVCRCCRIDHCRIQHLSCCIYNSQLAACTECRIPSQNNFTYNWRLHQKLLKVFAKDMNCPILCIFCQTTSDFPLNRRCDQTLVAVLHHFSKNRCCDRIFSYKHLPLDPSKNLFFRCIHLYCEDFFLLTTVQCKDTMSRKLLDRLLEFIIHLIYRRFLRLLCRRCNRTLFHSEVTNVDSVICLI